MSPIQSSIQEGLIVRTASGNLTGKEGYLAKLVDGTGEATVALAGAGELAPFVIEEGGASGELITLRPLHSGTNVRVISGATIAGGVLVASASTGKLAAATAGQYVVGVTEEDSASGNYTLIRPLAAGTRATVAAAFTAQNTDGEIAALTFSATATQAECEALRDKCEDLAEDILAIKVILDAAGITTT